MDFHSKKIIGWSYGTSMTADLAVKILHSDLGTQYTSDRFEKYLLKKKIRHSFSRKGCPYDNACIESFHSLLKKEEVHQKTYIDSRDAYNAVFEYIESWYNGKRIHSSIHYMTPDAVHDAGAA